MVQQLVFILEDEIHIQQLVKYNLESAGYKVQAFNNGESVLKEIQSITPNLLILDIMLPGIDGVEVCRQIRQNPRIKEIPIIMLTAKNQELDKILALEIGADDYITKPFSVRELVARVRALLRRTKTLNSSINDTIIEHGGLKIDNSKRTVFIGNNAVDLSFKEFELLRILMLHKGKVLSREFLLEKVWGFEYYGETRTVDVHIRYLRQKIEDDVISPKYIETVRGIGYRFIDRVICNDKQN